MSRIGKLPIEIPSGVEVKVLPNNIVNVKGKLGELSQSLRDGITLELTDNKIEVKRANDEKSLRALHGLTRSLVANMVKGVSEGYKIEQELVGVGYRASHSGQMLDLSLGFSHNVSIELPVEVKVVTATERGKNPLITLTSYDKQLLGQVAAKIRSLRPPEPYKGKGIKFANEVLRRKSGKTAGK
ncbi:MAG: 50S ribosomal protein L6 [Bacteroidia bacterium]|nr:50S ribosomal protein L6 [Bacteroidia bacterium]MCZ2247752.1 50S ribosomal protein L6 [Bacteroidia bacterium]